MSKSILQDEKVCYITGQTNNLHRHHIYAGTTSMQAADGKSVNVKDSGFILPGGCTISRIMAFTEKTDMSWI